MISLAEFISFLNKLETNNIFYKLNKVREEAIMIEVAVPGQRWEIEFMDNGTVEIKNILMMATITIQKN
jgi:hypothetical protein